MSGATNCPETPRQKMIGMMYLVLTAMLALNVSAQILEGYTTIYESMNKSVQIAEENNENLQAAFTKAKNENPVKASAFEGKVKELVTKSNEAFDYIEKFKKQLIYVANAKDTTEKGEDGKIKCVNPGELNAASQLLEGVSSEFKDGNKKWHEGIKEILTSYSEFAQEVSELGIPDSTLKNSIISTYKLEGKKVEGASRTWEQVLLEDQPAIAVLATMSKIQNDIRNTEAECMNHIIGQLEAGDFSVNKITALAIPDESYILRGGKYRAQIVLAAMDSTKKPEIEINGKPLEKEIYEVPCGSVGKQKYTGKIKLKKKNGQEVDYPFTAEYVVGEPQATVSADLMNVLYAGFNNPISVSVPGVDAGSVSISVTNATQTKSGKGWIIKPIKVGTPCYISVSAVLGGKSQQMAKHEFRVKKLPDPLAKLRVKDGASWTTFKGQGKPISKQALLTCEEVVAELDDADLNVKYQVKSFAVNYTDSMGNTMVEMAQGNKLTQKQKDVFKKMVKGKTVYVAQTKATGPDGITRTLPVLDIAIK